MAAEVLEGRCACGAVHYRLTSGPMFVHCCHCLDCQRQTGSAFVLNALIETDRIEVLTGETVPVRVPTDSGRPHDIYRCVTARPRCGAITAGGQSSASCGWARLNSHRRLKPDVHIYTRTKVPWVQLPEGVPVFREYYDAKVLWPAASLERRRAILG